MNLDQTLVARCRNMKLHVKQMAQQGHTVVVLRSELEQVYRRMFPIKDTCRLEHKPFSIPRNLGVRKGNDIDSIKVLTAL